MPIAVKEIALCDVNVKELVKQRIGRSRGREDGGGADSEERRGGEKGRRAGGVLKGYATVN